MTRQRQWQIRQREKGNCQRCGKPAQGRTHCDACVKRRGVLNRRLLRSQWEAVDWSKPNAVIARRFGVTTVAVRYQRKKRLGGKKGSK